MFSTGLKNFILILSIILIFHVLIKKALLSRREGFVCAADKTIASGPISNPVTPTPVEEKTSTAPKSTKDIYDMWFGEAGGGQAASSLDGFFKEDLDMSKEAAKAAECKVSDMAGGDMPLSTTRQGGEMPLSTTCDPVFDKMTLTEATAKSIKANCNLPQDKRGMMVLTEYENENPMSGGKLFLNLDAYDRDDLAYAPL
jgi:hypothetical protein